MPTSLTFDEHLAAIDAAASRLVALVVDAGLDAPVPTCPAWDGRALLAHQSMVHRWAAAHVRGDDPGQVPNQTALRREVADLPGYFVEGHVALVEALRAAPSDLVAMTFLNDAPPPRAFWGRRQAHETTIHMVDALGAALGRVPTTAEAELGAALAADGLDELLRGFFTRGRSKLYGGTVYAIAVVPSDIDRRWYLHVGPRLTVEPDEAALANEPATTLTGSAAGLYLALWNRGSEVEAEGRPDLLDQWRATQRVRWS